MSEVVREMTLKDRAQKWLDSYKKNDCISSDVYMSVTNWATIVAEYLHETDEDKTERLRQLEELKLSMAAMNRAHKELAAEKEKLKEALKASESACDYMGSQLTEARGKIKAYEFCIRCNGVSGAEVRE